MGLRANRGRPFPVRDVDVEKWIESLPLIQVAKSWGLSVTDRPTACGLPTLADTGEGEDIKVGVKHLSTCEVLVHAADDRLGTLEELGQNWRSETVAELGGYVLLNILCYHDETDLGGCWHYLQWYAAKEGIEVIDACGRCLERVCQSVALILDSAETNEQETNPIRQTSP